MEESRCRRVQRFAHGLEVGPELSLLLGGDRGVVEGRAPVGRALVHGQGGHLAGDGRNDLHAARSGADDGHPLAGDVDRRGGPQPGVVGLTSEVTSSRHLGEVGHREDAGGRHEVPRPVLGAVAGHHRPRPRRLVVGGRRDRGIEPHVPSEVEAVHHVVEVALDLRLFGEVLLPLPLLEQLLREQVGVGVALRVEPRPRVPIPVPGTTDAVAGLEQPGGEPGLEGAVELVDAGDTGADDQDVDVRRGRTTRLFGAGVRGCHGPPRR